MTEFEPETRPQRRSTDRETPPSRIQLVVAPTHTVFEQWCRDNGYNPYSPKRLAREVQRWTDLVGYSPRNADLVVLPDWFIGKGEQQVRGLEYAMQKFEYHKRTGRD